MSMQEWPDDHLDDLFRKSAEEFDVPPDPAHWADMNNRLDEHDRQGFYDRWRIWGGAAALTGLLLITLWWAWKVTTVAVNPVAEKTASQTIAMQRNATNSPETEHGKAVSAPATSAAKPTYTDIRPTDSRPTPGVVKQTDLTPDWAVRSRETAGQWRRRVVTSTPARIVVKQRNGATKQPDDENELVTTLNRPGLPATNRLDEKQRAVGQRVASRGRVGQPAPFRVVAEISAPTEKTTANGHRSDRSPEPTSSTNAPIMRSGGFSDQPQTQLVNPQTGDPGTVMRQQPDEPAAEERLQLGMASTIFSHTAVKVGELPVLIEPDWDDMNRPAKRVFVPVQRFSVMAVWSPDLSALGFQDFTKFGSNTGLLFQYRFSNRLSVQVGGLVSVKKYKSVADAYEWPTDPSFKWWPWPDAISGVCTMYDVPVNLRYDWLLRPRGDGMPPARWFVSSGLTSYFITREVYTYSYDDPTNPKITHQGWDNQKAGVAGGKFGFSNLNVSIGYERPMGRHFSWQVEPFLKIPLQQIGVFRVKLLSTGAFVGIKYSL